MAFPSRRVALSRAALAATVGLLWVSLGGLELAIPAVALVALVYWSHHLLAALAGDEVPHGDLAFVIVVNSAVVLVVQTLLFAANLDAF
jgi:hypothetical protein